MMKTQELVAVRPLLEAAVKRLDAAAVEAPRLDARLLMSAASGRSLEALVTEPERELSEDECRRFEALLARRLRREPVARILGQREFWSLPFALGPDTLVPRPESETLVEAALELAAAGGGYLKVLDLGTGSGCLLLAFLDARAGAEGIGVDLSEAACSMARRNAAALGLSARARFFVGDWDAALDARFDLVLANPPYIPDGAIAALAPEVARFEPRLALAGGPDGLACYRSLAPVLARRLAAGGHALIELGAGQGDAVAGILAGAGLHVFSRRLDLAGNERCLIISPAPPEGP
ncbi:MAG TPA: peptide chain release factor N(5)-glutamine methyltransferase [Alphaproteobacteria bacterium]|nr:peptide chain release factor N(5)-glutamine methyltransferase [Alphaproteobacteria bacterium]